jgi:isopentenyl diphosphate isomerase/L-lactate dehydrogenase-like FMN-dependent dehydrogenase
MQRATERRSKSIVAARASAEDHDVDAARRRFLGFLAASPLAAGSAGLLAGWPANLSARPELAIPDSASRALDIAQLKAVAQQRLDLPTWHFIVNGADDGHTLAANREAYQAWQIRARRLVDVSRVDTSLQLLGEQLDNPILLAPVGNQGSIHADAELASARAASKRKHLMISSTVSSASITEIAAATTSPLWFQLYASPDQRLMSHLLDKAAAAGCGTVVLTVDSAARGNREAERWFARGGGRPQLKLGNFADFDGPPRIGDPSMSWAIVDWLRSHTPMRIVLKGIVTREDAELAAAAGVDGLIVSNHGGRQEESGRGTLESLPEVLAGAGDLPVLLDGGIRRGTDIFKALALGARAVCIGRPYLWGLGAFGQDGVERSLAILRSELRRIMQLAGTPRLADISRAAIIRPGSGELR